MSEFRKNETEYFHLVGFNKSTVIGLIDGRNPLASATFARRDPVLKNATMPYELFNLEKQKEEVFEQIRAKKYPEKPPRLGSFFLFDDPALAKAKNQEWFQGKRILCKVQLLQGRTFKADSFWLNCKPENYEENAQKYWSGEMNQNPAPEIIFDGMIRLVEICI